MQNTEKKISFISPIKPTIPETSFGLDTYPDICIPLAGGGLVVFLYGLNWLYKLGKKLRKQTYQEVHGHYGMPRYKIDK